MSGKYYRLLSPYETRHAAWMYVSDDKSRAVVYYAVRQARPSNEIIRLKLKGLAPDKHYLCGGKEKSGRTLMNHGILMDKHEKDGDSVIFELDEI